jgi:hypothetical protein
MISNQDVLYNTICINNTNYVQILQIVIFIISLLVFNKLFHKGDISKSQKIENAKNYLKIFEKENEEFFITK